MIRGPEPAADALLAVLTQATDAAAPLPRTLVVVAHPDDETVGAGAQLPRLRGARFVVVTDGAPRDGRDAARHGLSVPDYAQLRRRELDAALALCGIPADRVLHLGHADQEAARALVPLARGLSALIAQEQAQAVLTHPYEGGHPDHDAVAFAVHAAAALCARQGAAPPAIVEFTSYHAAPQGLQAGAFLPHAGAGVAHMVTLDEHATAFKRALLACHASQRQTLQPLAVDVEGFRRAPAYDFRAAPHAGELHYERFPWGITGEEFRALADAALVQLGLEDGL